MVYIMELMKPTTVTEFIDMMRKNLRKLDPYKRHRFDNYYNDLLTYIDDYKELYRLLVDKNQHNSPTLNDREFGLIKIFGSKIDEYYFKRIKASYCWFITLVKKW